MFNYFSDVYQKIDWKILEKSIYVLIGQVNEAANIKKVYTKLLNLNILRGKGLFCQHIMQAQINSISNTQYYSALVSLVNLEVCKKNLVGMYLSAIEYLFTKMILFPNRYFLVSKNWRITRGTVYIAVKIAMFHSRKNVFADIYCSFG